MRKFFTNPLSFLAMGILGLLLAAIASAIPSNFFIGRALFAIGVLPLLIAAQLFTVIALKYGRAFYFSFLAGGIPEALSEDNKARVGSNLHIAAALLIAACAILSSH